MKIDEELIKKKFKTVVDVNCDFYQGSKEVKLSQIKIGFISITEGEYHNNCNVLIEGTGEFGKIDDKGGTIFDGVEKFNTYIKVENNNIIYIDRINLTHSLF